MDERGGGDPRRATECRRIAEVARLYGLDPRDPRLDEEDTPHKPEAARPTRAERLQPEVRGATGLLPQHKGRTLWRS